MTRLELLETRRVLATLLAWDFTGETTLATSTAEIVAANLDSSAVLTRGAGAAASAGANSFRTVGFQNNGIAVTNTDYFQATLSAAPGFKLSLGTLDARFAGTASYAASPGVSNQFAFSLDGTSFTLIGAASVTVGTPATLQQINLSTIAALQNIPDTTTVTFRYYASGQTATGGWGFNSPSSGTNGFVIDGTVAAAVDTTPPTLTFDDGDADDIVLANVLQTYTLTFNEDILDGSLTAADLDNAGTAAITLGTITETTPGVFAVQVTPTTAGTLILRIASGSLVEDVAGNDLVVPVQDDTMVTVTAGDVTSPAVTSIDDGDVDNLIGAGVTLNYTVTFTEDIDESTVTASDFLNSGTAIVTIGTIVETAAGIFSVQVTPTTGGTLALQIPAGAVIKDLAGNDLVVPVTDNDTVLVDATAPLLTSIVDNVGGGPAFQFQTITFTLTFDEDISASSVTSADFENAGTATIAVGAIAETSPGIFTVAVTPSTAGTVTLRIPTGSVISDVIGNNLVVPVLDDTTITITAVTALSAGDIAFTGMQTDAPDTFSFVLLKSVAAGTQITFTDNGWGSNAFANTTENTAIATFGSGLAAGAHLVISDNSGTATFFLVGTTTVAGTVVGNLSGLSASGDSILAYQGPAPTTDTAANWVAGINTRSFAASPANTNQSNLPSALAIGVTAIQFVTTAVDIDNGAYNKATFAGTVAAIRADVNNIANWTTSDTLGPVSTTVFTVGVDTTPPTVAFDDGDADDSVSSSTALTYTLTFSEDILDGSLTAADLDNSGTASITIGAISETAAGVFSVEVTPTSIGTIVLRIPAGALIEDLSGNDLVVPVQDDTTVNVTTSDTTPPTITSIDDGDADNLVFSGATLGYTVTFSEDIDASTVTSADFDNEGTAPITLGTISESSAGVFAIQVTATAAGTVKLRIPAGAVIKDVAGNDLVTPFSDNDTVDVDARLAIGNAFVTEGNSGAATLSFTVTLTGVVVGGFTASYTLTSVNAIAGTDYINSAGNLSFLGTAGEIQTVSVTINGDATSELNETVFATISSVDNRLTFTDAIGVGTIIDDDQIAPVGSGQITLSQVGAATLVGAEISAYDPVSKRLFVAGPTGLEIVDLTNPAAPTSVGFINPMLLAGSLATQPSPTSVAIKNGIVAISVPDLTIQNPGRVLFLNSAGALLGGVTVGALPDMVTFTPNGLKVLVANEGEPGVTDPVGSVSIIDLTNGPAAATLTTASFTSFDGQEATLRTQGIRIFPGRIASQDFEPEYITVSADNSTAYVTLQENNAIAIINIATAAVTSLKSLGTKNHFVSGSGLDASDIDNPRINIQQWPVSGLRMPDGAAAYLSGGNTFFVTANEGDDRNEPVRISSLNLDPVAFPNAAALKQNEAMGRLNVSPFEGDTDADGDYDQLFSYGARSFSIFDAAGNLVFDSGDILERITATATPLLFNVDAGTSGAVDTRSDNKGPEPEGLTVGVIGGQTYAFVGLERSGGGVTIFNITNPSSPTFVQYIRMDGHVGPEGLLFVSGQ